LNTIKPIVGTGAFPYTVKFYVITYPWPFRWPGENWCLSFEQCIPTTTSMKIYCRAVKNSVRRHNTKPHKRTLYLFINDSISLKQLVIGY